MRLMYGLKAVPFTTMPFSTACLAALQYAEKDLGFRVWHCQR